MASLLRYVELATLLLGLSSFATAFLPRNLVSGRNVLFQFSQCELEVREGTFKCFTECVFPWVSDPISATQSRALCNFEGSCCRLTDTNECTDGTHNCHAFATCQNTIGSYTCTCNTGYSGDGFTCTDIDECQTFPCSSGTCYNTPGSYVCCLNGQQFINGACVDINECALGTHGCDSNAVCSNINPGFTCTCNSGYSGSGFTCQDINECLSSTTCGNTQTCNNFAGGFVCCNSGQQFVPNTCIDINECATGVHSCSANAQCFNADPGYTCVCNNGYTGNGFTCTDVNECLQNPYPCGALPCSNFPGGFSCCRADQQVVNGVCVDRNECTDGTHNCDTNAVCTNINPGFRCTCNTGFTGDGTFCTDTNECASPISPCPSGQQCYNLIPGFVCCLDGQQYNPTTGQCDDIDECALQTDNCAADAFCININPGFNCFCNTGFNGDGVVCNDINECSSSALNNCDVNANCFNNPGSYSCTCRTGFSGNGFTCSDINECNLITNPCPFGNTCHNTIGSFVCCTSTQLVQGGVCVDRNECTDGTHLCDNNASCFNSVPSYNCVCNTGYTGSGFTCSDINECLQNPTICGSNGCVNTPGSYSCCASNQQSVNNFCVDRNECTDGSHLCDSNASCVNIDPNYTCFCNTGYTGSGFTCTDFNECLQTPNPCGTNGCINQPGTFACCLPTQQAVNNVCVDRNECTDGTASCDTNAICQNISPGFNCVCNAGYTGNGFTCAVDDECITGDHNCHADATCSNDDPSFTCQCKDGFFGDGVTCTASLNHPQCGTLAPQYIVENRLTFSDDELICRSPWQVSFRRFTDVSLLNQPLSYSTSAHTGGGVLIGRNYVLTTAFALIRAAKFYVSDPSYEHCAFVVAGSYNVNQENGQEQMRRIKDVHFHPLSSFQRNDDFESLIPVVNLLQMNTIQLEFNFVLVELETPFDVSDCVRPACVPYQNEFQSTGCGNPVCKTTGWGTNENRESFPTIRKANVRLYDKTTCEAFAYYDTGVRTDLPRATLCAANQNASKPCGGDFGGPVACDSSPPGQLQKYVLEAISMMTSIICNQETRPSFTIADVRSVAGWIAGVISPNLVF